MIYQLPSNVQKPQKHIASKHSGSLAVSTKHEPLYLQRTGAELLLGSIAYKLGQILGLISSWSRLPSLEFAGSANSGSCLCVQMAGKAEHGERRELLNDGKSALHLSMVRKEMPAAEICFRLYLQLAGRRLWSMPNSAERSMYSALKAKHYCRRVVCQWCQDQVTSEGQSWQSASSLLLWALRWVLWPSIHISFCHVALVWKTG